jgi:group II intron reverse transcriptase/maturase
VAYAQTEIRQGFGWVVDIDLDAFFDRVNHDRLMVRLKRHCPDLALLRLINRYLKAGVRIAGRTEASTAGVPQGGPLSPVLSNVVLDELDWELDRRGHRFARYADDCNIFVRSKTAGERVMKSVTRFLEESLRLKVNTRKSAVDRPAKRSFLGFTVSRAGARLKVADKAIDRLKTRVRELTRRTRGHRLADVIAELREALLGWKAYFGLAEVLSPLRDIDKWIRRSRLIPPSYMDFQSSPVSTSKNAFAAGDRVVFLRRRTVILRLTTGLVRGIRHTPGRAPSSSVDAGRMAAPTPAATRLIAVAWCCTS